MREITNYFLNGIKVSLKAINGKHGSIVHY